MIENSLRTFILLTHLAPWLQVIVISILDDSTS
jgi:hypothetical protein